MRAAVLMLVPAACGAALLTPADRTSGPRAPGDPLAFTQNAALLGRVGPAPEVGHRFRFRNASGEAVTVVGLDPSCGCLDPKLSGGTAIGDGREFAPGEEGSVEVRMSTVGEPPGPQRYTVNVRTRQGGSAVDQRVVFAVELPEAKVTMTPPAVAFLQVRGEAGERSVTIRDPRPRPLSVLGVDSDSEWVTPSLTSAADGRETVVTVACREGLPPGRRDATVSVRTDDPDYATLRIAVALDGGTSRRADPTPVTGTGSR